MNNNNNWDCVNIHSVIWTFLPSEGVETFQPAGGAVSFTTTFYYFVPALNHFFGSGGARCLSLVPVSSRTALLPRWFVSEPMFGLSAAEFSLFHLRQSLGTREPLVKNSCLDSELTLQQTERFTDLFKYLDICAKMKPERRECKYFSFWVSVSETTWIQNKDFILMDPLDNIGWIQPGYRGSASP